MLSLYRVRKKEKVGMQVSQEDCKVPSPTGRGATLGLFTQIGQRKKRPVYDVLQYSFQERKLRLGFETLASKKKHHQLQQLRMAKKTFSHISILRYKNRMNRSNNRFPQGFL